jgi:hypothetical protein
MVNLGNILRQLRARRDAVNESILVLERLAAGRGPQRSRPMKSMTPATVIDAPRRRPKPV